jgi:hypothetical protein
MRTSRLSPVLGFGFRQGSEPRPSAVGDASCRYWFRLVRSASYPRVRTGKAHISLLSPAQDARPDLLIACRQVCRGIYDSSRSAAGNEWMRIGVRLVI